MIKHNEHIVRVSNAQMKTPSIILCLEIVCLLQVCNSFAELLSCSNETQVLESGKMFTITNCTLSEGHIDFEEQVGEAVANVSVVVIGGNVIPRLSIRNCNVSNLTVHLVNVKLNASKGRILDIVVCHTCFVSHVALVVEGSEIEFSLGPDSNTSDLLPLLLSVNSSYLNSQLCSASFLNVTIVRSALQVVVRETHAVAFDNEFFSWWRAWLVFVGGQHLELKAVTINAIDSRVFAKGVTEAMIAVTVHSLSPPEALRQVAVTLLDGLTVAVQRTTVNVSALRFSSLVSLTSVQFPHNDVALLQNVLFRLDDSNLSVSIACDKQQKDRVRCVQLGVNVTVYPHGILRFAGHNGTQLHDFSVSLARTISHAVIEMDDTTPPGAQSLSVVVFQGFLRVSRGYIQHIGGDVQPHFGAVVVSKSVSALIHIANCVDAVGLSIVVANTTANLSSCGAIADNTTVRSVAVISIQHEVKLVNSSIRMSDVRSTQFLLGGEPNEAAAASSGLLALTSTMLLVSANLNNTTVAIVRCALHGTTTQGTLAFATPPVLASQLSMSLLFTDKLCRARNSTILIRHSALYGTCGYRVPNASTFWLVFSSQAMGLALTYMSCYQCSITLASSNVTVVKLDFPATTIVHPNEIRQNATFLMNAGDFLNAFSETPFGWILRSLRSGVDLSKAVMMSNSEVTILDCRLTVPIHVPLQPVDTVALFGVPNEMQQSNVFISTPHTRESCSDAVCVGNHHPPDVVLATGSAHIMSSLFDIDHPTPDGVVGFVFRGITATVVISDSRISVRNVAVVSSERVVLSGTPPSVFAAPTGTFYGKFAFSSKLVVNGSTTIVLSDTSLHRLKRIFGLSSSIVWQHPSTFQFGCVDWRPARCEVPQSDGGGAHCPRMTYTEVGLPTKHIIAHLQEGTSDLQCTQLDPWLSASGTPTLRLVEDSYPAVAASTAAQAMNVVSATIGVAAVVLSLAGGSVGAAALGDAQFYASLSDAPCAGPGSDSAATNRIALSPFASFGRTGVVFGNCGLLCCLVVAHVVAVRCFRWYSRRRGQHCSTSREEGCQNLPSRVLVAPSAEVRARYPNYSFAAAAMLMPGVVNCSVNIVSTGSALDVCAACVGVCAVGGFVYVRYVLRVQAQTRLRFQRYRVGVLRESQVPVWALPIGRWMPHTARATHGRLLGGVRDEMHWLAAYPIVYSFAMQFLLGLPVSSSWCSWLWCCTIVPPLIGISLLAWYRPGRIPLSDVTTTVSFVVVIAVCITAAVERHDANDADAEGSGALMLVLSGLATLLRVVAVVHAGYILWWEARIVHSESENHNEHRQGSSSLREPPTLISESPSSAKKHRSHRRHSRPHSHASDGHQLSTDEDNSFSSLLLSFASQNSSSHDTAGLSTSILSRRTYHSDNLSSLIGDQFIAASGTANGGGGAALPALIELACRTSTRVSSLTEL